MKEELMIPIFRHMKIKNKNCTESYLELELVMKPRNSKSMFKEHLDEEVQANTTPKLTSSSAKVNKIPTARTLQRISRHLSLPNNMLRPSKICKKRRKSIRDLNY
jgi:membrane-bound lytic murein transglycosylase MltF